MDAKQLFHQGDLSGAIDSVIQEVKSHPTDLPLRTFLFELLCFNGDLDRAEKQLDVVGHQDAMAEPAAQVYRNILKAEQQRRRVHAGNGQPEFLLDPPAYARLHIEALTRLREDRPTDAMALLDESESVRAALRGTVNEQPFEGFRDCDDVVGPFLELIILQDYVWLPFEQLRELEMEPPERPRDLLWAPARFVLGEDEQRRGYIPVLYAGSHEHEDNQVKLGRATDWNVSDDGPTRGLGQRLFLTGEEGLSILETRHIEFSSS